MNEYVDMMRRHEREISEFPMFFAFNQDQFREGMKTLGLKESDTNKIYTLAGTGGFYRKSDAPKLHDLFFRHTAELNKAISEDKDGTGFIYQMFLYELNNHEYSFTGDLEPALSACGLEEKDVMENPALKKGLERAIKKVLQNS